MRQDVGERVRYTTRQDTHVPTTKALIGMMGTIGSREPDRPTATLHPHLRVQRESDVATYGGDLKTDEVPSLIAIEPVPETAELCWEACEAEYGCDVVGIDFGVTGCKDRCLQR